MSKPKQLFKYTMTCVDNCSNKTVVEEVISSEMAIYYKVGKEIHNRNLTLMRLDKGEKLE